MQSRIHVFENGRREKPHLQEKTVAMPSWGFVVFEDNRDASTAEYGCISFPSSWAPQGPYNGVYLRRVASLSFSVHGDDASVRSVSRLRALRGFTITDFFNGTSHHLAPL